jgi:AraC family transcriptional regulator of arabinose operon
MEDVLPEEPAPPPGKLLAGYFSQPYGYHVRRSRGTHDWLLTLTIGGEGCFRINETRHVCRHGSIVLLSPGTPHDYFTPSDKKHWDFYWAHFTPRADWIAWLKWSNSGLSKLAITDADEYKRLQQTFNRLVHDSRDIDIFHNELADNALAELLMLLARHHLLATKGHLDSRVMHVLRRLADEFNQDLSVTDLAHSVSMSPSRLSHLFAAQTGESIMRARMRLRMRHAERLLEVTSQSVSDIAHDAGFKSLFQFSRQFSRWHDMSPSEYRRKLHSR